MKTIKIGDVASETQFYTVKTVNGNQVILKNDDGEEIEVNKGYAESFLSSASEFEKTETLSRTEVIEKFMTCTAVAITVNFNKKVDAKDVLLEIMNTHNNTAPKDVEKAFKATVKRALEGEERLMVGRHFGSLDVNSRLHFVDMQIAKDPSKDYDTRNRLVDPRTINYFICRGVKYQVK
jgi:hypothetical protein